MAIEDNIAIDIIGKYSKFCPSEEVTKYTWGR